MPAGNLALMLPVLTVLSAAQDGIRGFRDLALDRLLSVVLNTGASLAALVGVAFVAPSLQEAVHGTAFTLLVGMTAGFATFVASTALGLAAAVLRGMSRLPPRGC